MNQKGFSIQNECKYMGEEKYCMKTYNQRDCDREYIKFENTSVLNRECFLGYVTGNLAVQIYDYIYLGILYPTTIHLNCGKSDMPLYLNRSTNIKLHDCSIKTTFFEYNRNSGSVPYKVYPSTHTENELDVLSKKAILERKDRLKKLFYEFVCVLIILIIIALCALLGIEAINYKQTSNIINLTGSYQPNVEINGLDTEV